MENLRKNSQISSAKREEQRYGALKIANRRFEAIRANRERHENRGCSANRCARTRDFLLPLLNMYDLLTHQDYPKGQNKHYLPNLIPDANFFR